MKVYLLPPLNPVRDHLLGELPHPPGSCPRQDGAPRHPLPRPRQHLQHRHHQHPKGEKHDFQIIFTTYETHTCVLHMDISFSQFLLQRRRV